MHRTPQGVHYEAWSFSNFKTGVTALRTVLDNGHRYHRYSAL